MSPVDAFRWRKKSQLLARRAQCVGVDFAAGSHEVPVTIPLHLTDWFSPDHKSRGDEALNHAFAEAMHASIKDGHIPWWQFKRRCQRGENISFAEMAVIDKMYELAIEWAADAGADREQLVTQYMLIFGHAPLYTWD